MLFIFNLFFLNIYSDFITKFICYHNFKLIMRIEIFNIFEILFYLNTIDIQFR